MIVMTVGAHAQHSCKFGLVKSVAWVVHCRGWNPAVWAPFITSSKIKSSNPQKKRMLLKEWALRTAIALVQASAVLVYFLAIVCHIGL